MQKESGSIAKYFISLSSIYRRVHRYSGCSVPSKKNDRHELENCENMEAAVSKAKTIHSDYKACGHCYNSEDNQ